MSVVRRNQMILGGATILFVVLASMVPPEARFAFYGHIGAFGFLTCCSLFA